MVRIYHMRTRWEPAISDGLTLPCYICREIPKFDYSVDHAFWKEVVEKKYRLGVICLPCLDKLATAKGLNLSKHLIEVQFTGIKKTIVLVPTKVFDYSNFKRKKPEEK